MALLAAVGAIDPEGPWEFPGEELSYAQIMGETLERAVGDREELDHLGVEPLPGEAFDWTGIPDDIRERVTEVVELCDRCCEELLDQEFRTACPRLLARVAQGDANVFRRAGRPDTAAAAICWVIGKANDLFSPAGRGMLVKDLLAHFGMKQGSVSQRAQTLLRAGGFDSEYHGGVDLGTPQLLISGRRKRIVELRDRYESLEST